MGRRAEHLRLPPRSLDGLTERTYEPGIWDEEFRILGEDWTHSAVMRIRQRIQEAVVHSQGARKFNAESLFGILMLSVRLGLSLTDAIRRLRNDSRLLSLYGLESIPSRQVVANFRNKTLPATLGDLAFIRAEAYLRIPAELIALHGLDTTKLVLDCSALDSPNTGHRKEGGDIGAEWMMFDKKWAGPRFGRQKATVMMVGDAPLVVAGLCVHRPSEIELVCDELIPQLVEYSPVVGQLVEQISGTLHKGFKGAALTADQAFAKEPQTRLFVESGFIPVYRCPSTADLKYVRAIPQFINGSEELFPVRNDCAILCACGYAEPMERRRHGSGLNGGIYVRCTDPLCKFSQPRFYVAATAKVLPIDEHGNKTSNQAEPAMRYLAVEPSYSLEARGLYLKSSNVVEAHHSQMERKFAFGAAAARIRRHIRGDFQFALYDVMANLLWNIDVGRNLEIRGGVGEVLDWVDLADSARKNAKAIETRKAKSEQGDDEEDTAEYIRRPVHGTPCADTRIVLAEPS